MAKELITHDVPKIKKKRTPKDFNAIQEGALKLSFEERIILRDGLTRSIELELKEMEEKFHSAQKLITGHQ